MILNMTGAGNNAQFIQFTVSESTVIHTNYFTVNNVKIAKGTVKGFFISRFDNFVTGTGAVHAVYKELPTAEVTSGMVQAVLYDSNGTNNYYVYNPTSGTDFEYDDSAETFKFRVRLQGSINAYLSPGTYQLVIW